MSDVSPRVADVMETQIISVAHDSSIYHAMNSIEKKRIRGLPVVDAEDRCLGLLSGWKVSQYLFPQREEAPASREIFASISDIAHSFDGEFLVGEPKDSQQKVVLMVAAMSLASFGERLRRYPLEETIVFVGDREDIQLEAITNKALASLSPAEWDFRPRSVRRRKKRECGFCRADMIRRRPFCWRAGQLKSIR